MSELNRPTAELAKVVSKIQDARHKDLDWHIQSEAQKQVNTVETTKTIDLTKVNPDHPNWKKEVSLDSGTVDSKMRNVLIEGRNVAEDNAEDALDMWDNLQIDAVEKFGANAEGGNAQAEGKVAAESIIKEHEMVAGRHETLASYVIDHMKLDVSDDVSDHKLLDVLDIDWDSYAADAGVSRESITVGLLKRDPAFQAFRNDIVKKVQQLASETNIDLKQDWKSPKKLLSKMWSNFTLSSKVGFAGQERTDFNLDLNNARKLSEAQANLANLPSLESAQEYRQNYAKFLQKANIALDLKDVADAMPAFSRLVQEKHGQKLEVENEAKNDLRAKRKEFVKTGRDAEAQAAILQSEAEAVIARQQAEKLEREAARILAESEQKAKERAARMELSDLSIQATSFAETARLQRRIGMIALVGIAEKGYANREVAKFEKKISDQPLPQELQELFHGDGLGKSVDEFIESNGRKGDIQEVQHFFTKLAQLANKADMTEGGLPTSFLPLNTLENEQSSLETGVSVGLSQDGSWELRLATRRDGKIDIKNTSPVIRMEPENILASINGVMDREQLLSEAEERVRELEFSTSLPGGNKSKADLYKARLASAQKTVMSEKKSLASAKSELAKELQASGAHKKLSEAFAEITNAQAQVAEKFFNEDFDYTVNLLSKELNIPTKDVTVEVLASVAASAEHGQMVASDMADFFEKMSQPLNLDAEIIGAHSEELDKISAELASLQLDESTILGVSSESARSLAKAEITRRQVELQREVEKLAKTFNREFVQAAERMTPEALLKGSKSIPMTKPEFKKAYASMLRNTGFNPKDFGEIIKKGPNRGMTLAEVVREGSSYDTELMDMADASTDALRALRTSNASIVLGAAVNKGDVKAFIAGAKSIVAESTAEKIGTMQVDAEMKKIEQMASSPEGLAQLMRGAEVRWSKVLDAVDEGKLGREVAYPAILASEVESDKLEAARRVQGVLMQTIAPMIDVVGSDEDPLQGRDDVIRDIKFLNEATNGATTGFLQVYLERATAEKKTTVA